MIANHAEFILAVHEKKKVWIKYYSKADSGVLEQVCAPLEYGPGSIVSDGLNRYWLWDYASDTGAHTLSLLPQQIVELKILGEVFDPAQFTSEPLPLAASKN